MRLRRQLAENVWYEVRTAINVGEPLFQLSWAAVLFYRVLREAKERFRFKIRGLTLGEAWLTFYIKPKEGLKLPKIMQWVKQTFSARFNVCAERTGHIWGNRYRSEILAGEPPPEAGEVDWAMVEAVAKTPVPMSMTYKLSWDSPRSTGKTRKSRFSFKISPGPAPPGG